MQDGDEILFQNYRCYYSILEHEPIFTFLVVLDEYLSLSFPSTIFLSIGKWNSFFFRVASGYFLQEINKSQTNLNLFHQEFAKGISYLV